MPKGYVLFFTPEAGVVPHFSAQCNLANMAKAAGHDVLFVRCGGIYNRCPVMDMYQLPHAEVERNKARLCEDCSKGAAAILEAHGLEMLELRDFMDDGLLAEVDGIMDSSPRNLVELEYDGVPFGKMACVDFVLNTKVSNFAELSDEKRAVWAMYVRNSLVTYLLMRRLMDRLPIKAVVHHEDYSILLAARMAAEKRGIPCTHIGFPLGSNRQRYFIMHRPGYGEDQRMMAQWDRWRDLSLTPDLAREPMDDLLGRLGGTSGFVFSPKKTVETGDLRARLGIPPGKKLLVAFTSSLDERLAGDFLIEGLKLRMVDVPQPFKDQIEWLKGLVEFVRSRDEYQLVVRIHPREGANKRVSIVSEHLVRLKEAFGSPSRNSLFIWPEDQVSSYDLAELADLVLTAWTTMGLEVGRLAVPVLTCTYGLGPRPNDDFHEWAPTPAAFFVRIDELIRRPPALETVLHSFRWHMVLYQHHSLDFSDLIPAKDFNGFPVFRMPAEGRVAVDAMLHQADVLELNRMRLRALQMPGASLAAERKTVRIQMRRALHFMFTGEDRREDFTVILVETGADPEAFRRRLGVSVLPRDVAVVLAGAERVHYLSADGVRTRISPLCRRLALLGCQHGLLDGGFGVGAKPPPEASLLASEAQLAPLVGAGPGESALKEIAALRDAGDLAGARRRIAEAQAAHGDSPGLLNLLGHVESLSGNGQAAKAIFQRIGREWPAFAKAHLNLALMSWNEGDQSGSLEHLANALEHGSGDVDVVRGGLRLLKRSGLDGEAEALLSRFAANHPSEAAGLASVLKE